MEESNNEESNNEESNNEESNNEESNNEVYMDYDEFIKISEICHRCKKRQDKKYMVYCCQLKSYFCDEFLPFFKSCHDLFHQIPSVTL